MLTQDIDGVVLGTFPYGESVILGDEDRRRGAYLIGKTGTGKSTTMRTMMMSDLERGRGFALLDPHGVLADQIADSIPHARFNDTIYVDAADTYHLGFNPLHNVGPRERPLVASHVASTFTNIWRLSLEDTPRLLYILTNAVRLLLDTPGTTLLGLPRLLVDADYRRRLLLNLLDPTIRNFWENEFMALSERDQALAVSPIQNKVGMLLNNPMLRNVLCQPRSTLDIGRVMDEGQVLLVNLNRGKIGDDPSHLLGAFLVTAFAQAASARNERAEDGLRDATLYADEFQRISTDSFESILSEARKARLNLVLAHQFGGQLPPLLRQSILGNVGTLIVYRVGGDDAEVLRLEMKNTELVYDQSHSAYINVAAPIVLTDTPNRHAWIKLLEGGAPTEIRLAQMLAPEPSITGRLAAVRRRSRARFMRSAEVIEEKIGRFLAPATPKRKRSAKPTRARTTIMWPMV